VAKEVTVAKAVVAKTVVEEAATVGGPDGSSSGGPGAVQMDAREAPDVMSDPKVAIPF
jgi:hypothetical protein